MNYKELIRNDVDLIKSKIDFSDLKNKKVLITGASGIVGIYLVNSISSMIDVDIHAWVNSEISKEFSELFKNVTVKRLDLSSDFDCDEKFDYIIHSAGYGQPGKFLENGLKTIQINTTATAKLISMLNADGKFLFISTSELYSGNDSENITENEIGSTNTNHSRACYIEGKRCGEAICFTQNNPNIKVARLSLAYGPGTKVSDQRVLNQFIEKALKFGRIDLMDSGSAIRTYCYITDAVEMFWNILLKSKSNLYNVGGFSKISILDLSKQIGDKLDVPVNYPQTDNLSAIGNPKVVNISIDKYLEEFEKKDFINLDEGLNRTILWQKQIYKNEQNNL